MTDIGSHPEPRMVARQAPQTQNGVPVLDQRLDIDISIVMPCLNEEAAVSSCVEIALASIAATGLSGEVVVVDNDSSDASAELAAMAGARVVREPVRGYGNAYLRGLAEARGRFIVLGDSDGTYDFGAIATFIEPLTNGTDLVIGSRLRGTIDVGAMPWLHRYVGNPLLTKTMNLLFSHELSDVYCGMRSIKREALSELTLSAPGMEFALEMLIAAERSGIRIKEIPIRYRRRQGGTPKLRTWRDGWRSLRFIFAASRRYESVHVHNHAAFNPPTPAPSESGS
ncbi:MAG: glycosyltransferase family 2 protein [Acidimicrobiia bacterium]